MASYGQDERIAEVTTKFGPNKLALTRFTGNEAMSHLFEFRVEGISKDPNLDFSKQLGQNVTVTLHTNGHGDRYFTGTCTEIQRLGTTDGDFAYILVLRPSIWLLSKRVNSRSFQNETAQAIIKKILSDYAGVVEAPGEKISGNHPALEYCVQHRETDLNFILRLMEAEGISYHFEFGDDSQKMILCDAKSAYEPVPDGTRQYHEYEEFHHDSAEHFFTWVPEGRFTTNRAVLTDYKLQQPGDDNYGDKDGDARFTPKLEHYDHPFPLHLGEKTSPDYGKIYAETRALSERGGDGRYLASGDCGSLVPGNTVTLAGLPSDNTDYLVVGCAHTIDPQPYRSRDDDPGMLYRGDFELMKLARFVPAIVTPKPVIGGPQTGVVVGNNKEGSNNEIYTDEWGRIKVHMHWNRQDKGEKAGQTMWCRLAHSWAGQEAEWGTIFIPRVGMEVLVEFLDGDPDRPVVTGCVYHKDNKPPYALPDNAFMAGWKSKYEKRKGYNEIVMIDKSGEEKIRVHTDHDLVTEVINNETRTVDKNRTTEIKVDDTHDIGRDLKVTAISSITLTVGASKITMDPGSITIESPMITITASAHLTTEGKAMADHKAGIMTITGALVKIN